MAYGLIDYNTLKNIGNAIRSKTNYSGNYYPREMANAINQIRSGGGYEYPILPSVSYYCVNEYDNDIIHRDILLDFEMVNQFPENNVEIIDITNAEGLSPDNVIFYKRYVTNYPKNSHSWDSSNNNYPTYYYNGFIYGLYANPIWNSEDISIGDMSELFRYSYYIDNAFCGRYTTSLHGTYESCSNIRSAVCGPRVEDMSAAYRSCSNLINAVCGNNVKWFASAYSNCYNLINGVCGPKVVSMKNSYNYCTNLVTAEIGSNVRYLDGAFSGDFNLSSVSDIPEATESMNNCFYSCKNLNSINVLSSNIRYADGAFNQCSSLQSINGPGFNDLRACYDMFNNCLSLVSITNLHINSENMANIFGNCVQLQNVNLTIHNFVNEQPTFSSYPLNFYMNYAFSNCYNLSQNSYEQFMPTLLNYVKERDNFPEYNPQNTYYTNDFVIYNNMVWYYYGNEPITGEFNSSNWSSRTRYYLSALYAFANCKQLTKVWVSNLMDAQLMYTGAGDITEVVYEGDIINLSSLFQSSNILNASCPDTVRTFYQTFQNCQKLTDAVCGNNVDNFSFTYSNCHNLVNAACGPNVNNMWSTYEYCNNLQVAVCGNSVVNMNATYANCHNLIEAACGPMVYNMNMVYQHCHSLTNAVCGDSVLYMNNTYTNCWNLINSASGLNVISMVNTYYNCRNLKTAVIGPNVAALTNTFKECISLDSDVEIGNNMYNMLNAFYNCRNINNYYIASNRMTSYTLFANAFYSLSPYNRRNIVLANRLVFNALSNTYCRAFATSSIYYTNEAYQEPVGVNVNGNTYNCVRCAYNTTYNCYIYCME